jgi:hypothetical protein
MAFDVTYAAFDFAPTSGLTWGDAFIWLNAHVNGGATEVSVTNSDGSITLFTGTGFTLDASGLPIAGDVTQVQRVSADGATLYEQYDFVTPSSQQLDRLEQRRELCPSCQCGEPAAKATTPM